VEKAHNLPRRNTIDRKRAQLKGFQEVLQVQLLETLHIFLMLQTMFNVHGM